MFARSKFFLQFVEEMKKLKLSLSKQHKKMLKIKPEMLKIRKNVKIIKLEKNFSQKFSGISRNSREIFYKFPVSRVVENP